MILRIFIAVSALHFSTISSYKLKRDELEPILVTSKPLRFGNNKFEEVVTETTISPHFHDTDNFKPSKELLLVPAREYQQMNNYQLYHGDLDSIIANSKLHSSAVESPKNIHKHLLMLDTQPGTLVQEPYHVHSKESLEDIGDSLKEELVYGKWKPQEEYFEHGFGELGDPNLSSENVKKHKEKGRNSLYQSRENNYRNIRQKYKQKENIDYFHEDAQRYHAVAPTLKFKTGVDKNRHENENGPTDLSAHYLDHILEDNYWYQYHKSQQKRPTNKNRHRIAHQQDSKGHHKKDTERKQLKYPNSSYCNVRNKK